LTPTTQALSAGDKQAHNAHLAELLKQCAQGKESAFEELYSLCSSQLYSVVVRILRIEGVAEEALQDAFIKIWQQAGTYIPSSGSPMGWMYSIARHQALDLLRRRSTREKMEYGDGNELIGTAPDERKSIMDMSEDADVLMQCLEKLPDSARLCVVSAYCEGYSYDELANSHGSPPNTIKSWVRRGLIALRTCIDEHA